MDKHTTIYNLTIMFMKYDIDEEQAYEMAVKSEKIIEQGFLEVAEKIGELVACEVVKKAKECEPNG